MKGKLYSLLIIVPVACFALVLVGLSFYLQPFYGDLTRVGGYPENLYGWNEPQLGFSEIGTSYLDYREVDDEIDYLVLGDSFSHICGESRETAALGCFQWTAFFKDITGYNGFTFHQDSFSIKELAWRKGQGYSPEELISKIQALDLKPKFVVFQSVERLVASRLQRYARILGCGDSEELLTPQLRPYESADLFEKARVRAKDALYYDLNAPISVIKHRLSRKKQKQVNLIPVNTDLSLFSSEIKDEVLVSHDDFKLKYRLTDDDIVEARCGLKAFSGFVQRELGIPVVFAITPDKSSIYQEWSTGYQYQVPSIIPKLASDDVWFIDLREPMIEAVKKGVTDVYMPNDTHWGANGAKIASNELIKLLDQMKASGK